MLSNAQPHAGTLNSKRQNFGGAERSTTLTLVVNHSAPRPAAVSTCHVHVDGGGWEYIDMFLSQVKND